MRERAFTSTIPGAVLSGDNPQIVYHYGDLSGEQWALESGKALTDFSDLGVVRVTGADRLSWLTTLSTQVLTDLQPGVSREFLLLDPQGRIQFTCCALDDGQGVYLLLEGARVTSLIEFLRRMQFLLRVEVTDVSSDFLVFATVIPATKLAAGKTAFTQLPGVAFLWEDSWPGIVPGGASYTPSGFSHPASIRTRVFLLVEASAGEAFTAAWGACSTVNQADSSCPWAGRNAWEALRIEDLRPAFSEVDDKTLPHELDWLRTAVHLNKGCYCGQESVARIVNLGKPPRRLVLLQLDGSQSITVKPSAAVFAGKRQVGVVTAAARHADLGPVALALVRRGLAADLPLTVVQGEDEVPALQEVIVDPLGRSSVSPAERPGAELRGVNLRPREI